MRTIQQPFFKSYGVQVRKGHSPQSMGCFCFLHAITPDPATLPWCVHPLQGLQHLVLAILLPLSPTFCRAPAPLRTGLQFHSCWLKHCPKTVFPNLILPTFHCFGYPSGLWDSKIPDTVNVQKQLSSRELEWLGVKLWRPVKIRQHNFGLCFLPQTIDSILHSQIHSQKLQSI